MTMSLRFTLQPRMKFNVIPLLGPMTAFRKFRGQSKNPQSNNPQSRNSSKCVLLPYILRVLTLTPPICRRIPGKKCGLMVLLYCVSISAVAETPLRNSFDNTDMQLLAETNLAYTSCLQEHAREHVDSSPDIRVIAENAAEACNPLLTELEKTLTDRSINPAFFTGAVTRIKNRAIRRVLPLLMMEKSNQGS